MVTLGVLGFALWEGELLKVEQFHIWIYIILNSFLLQSLLGLTLSCTDYWNEMGAKCSCLNACLSCSDHYQTYNLTKCQIQCTVSITKSHFQL